MMDWPSGRIVNGSRRLHAHCLASPHRSPGADESTRAAVVTPLCEGPRVRRRGAVVATSGACRWSPCHRTRHGRTARLRRRSPSRCHWHATQYSLLSAPAPVAPPESRARPDSPGTPSTTQALVIRPSKLDRRCPRWHRINAPSAARCGPVMTHAMPPRPRRRWRRRPRRVR